MFFGQSVARVFDSMLKPAAELFGVSELWGLTLQDIFLPVMEALFPLFLGMMEFFMNLPEPVKMAIGIFGTVAAVLGKVLFIGGSVVLGLQAIGTAIGSQGLVTAAAAGGKALIGFLGPIGWVTAAIVAAVVAWNTNFAGFKDTVISIFDNLKEIFGNIIDFIKNVFTGNWSEAWDNLKDIAKGAFKIIGEFVALLLDAFGKLTGIKGASQLAQAIRDRLRETKIPNVQAQPGMVSSTGSILGITNPNTPIGASQISIANSYDIKVSDKSEWLRAIEERDRQTEERLRGMAVPLR
jgi:hypothetical protein